MFDTIATFYVQSFGIFLTAVVIGLLALGAFRANMAPRRAAWIIAALAAFLSLWFVAMGPLARAGLLLPPPTLTDPPFALMPLIGGAVLLWSLGRFTQSGRAILSGLDQHHLIGFQVFRMMGGLFLLGWAMGRIPWEFALPAGVGDVWAGVAAMRALSALNRGEPDAGHKVLWANVVGLTDFAVAVAAGVTTSEGFLHILSLDAPNIINLYPLALFPAYFVPIFIAFHLFSLARLGQGADAVQTAHA
ncbi:hypothetical protein [Roseibium aggregatum]|uniref:Uncharacterized protein n=1 Tax=Roseibium aggregatum TaxID=187304 RepID=A0A926P3R9_9HYPH|nr:hypothetical protein [Roseibium aggregatum]MBD1549645.1 hypothetical protein [Roseibium aggregatum]